MGTMRAIAGLRRELTRGVIWRCDIQDFAELKRFGSQIWGMGRGAAAKLLDKEGVLNYNACQAITG